MQIWLFEQTDLRIEGRIIVSQPCRLVQPRNTSVVPDLIRSPSVLCELLRHVQGFDEYMNLVLDEAEEVSMKRKTRKALGEYSLLACFCIRNRLFSPDSMVKPPSLHP